MPNAHLDADKDAPLRYDIRLLGRILGETVRALRDAQQAAADGREEIMAEHLRLASRALGKLLGRVDVEDVLDVIFRDFCIGK